MKKPIFHLYNADTGKIVSSHRKISGAGRAYIRGLGPASPSLRVYSEFPRGFMGFYENHAIEAIEAYAKTR